MRETFAYLQSFAGFPRALRAYLSDPLTLPRARAIVADRFAIENRTFCASWNIRSTGTRPVRIWRACATPVASADLEALVRREGVDRAQIDDYGSIEQRDCGCPLHAAGFTSSMHSVRSYSKFLGESVTLMGHELQRVLEDVLPRRFGGSVMDYQLLEREDRQGLTRVFLIVSPKVPLTDDQEPARVLLEAFRASGARGDSAGSIWQQAGTLRVLRQEPAMTARGKQLPLHRERSAS